VNYARANPGSFISPACEFRLSFFRDGTEAFFSVFCVLYVEPQDFVEPTNRAIPRLAAITSQPVLGGLHN
jgi:hypothetical protein